MRRQSILRIFAALALAAVSLAHSQTWPGKTVRVILPYAAGGSSDVIARAVAQRVAQNTGQAFVVDNRPGAGGALGTAEVARAAPDGYTLLFTNSSHTILQLLGQKLPYDPVGDFTPIAHLADSSFVLLVSPALPARNVAELIALARKQPGHLNGATSNGTIVQLTTEAFKAQADVSITDIPYKSSSLAIPELIAGNVDLLFDPIPSGMPQVKSGRLKALAVTGPRRSSLAPEVPTLAESGLPGFSSVAWFGLYAPRGMNADLVRHIHAEFAKALQSPEIVARLSSLGAEAAGGSPADFAAMVARDSARWNKLVRERKLKLE